jgi:hypothetical protein
MTRGLSSTPAWRTNKNVKDWEQFAPDIKTTCRQEATDIAGIRSYVELLTCLQIAREAAKLPKQ